MTTVCDSSCAEGGVGPNGVCQRSVKAAAAIQGCPGSSRGERLGSG